MATTMNGRTRIDVADGRLTTITAGGRSTRVLAGDSAVVLAYAARRFHAEVEPLTTCYGWRSLATNTASGGIGNSNHLSGTALDLNGARHPRYKHGTFTTAQVAALRKILAAVNAAAGAVVLRWGGDWGTQVDEMHIELVGATTALARAAAAITAGRLTSSSTTTTGTVSAVPSLTAPTPLTPIAQEDDMRIIAQQTRGTWLIGAGYAHKLTSEEWAQLSIQEHGHPVVQFADGAVGERVFDLTKAAYTTPTA